VNVKRTVQAICVPEIRTKLAIPKLAKIVDGFLSRGYKLADEDLSSSSDEISNIGFVLGTSDSDLLLEKQIVFGDLLPSVFSETIAGILLYGN
jgi:hypothetical protein